MAQPSAAPKPKIYGKTEDFQLKYKDKKEVDEARDICLRLKTSFGVSFDSTIGKKSVKDSSEVQSSKAKEKVHAAPWIIEELRAIERALNALSPLLGAQRAKNPSRLYKNSPQRLKTLSKVQRPKPKGLKNVMAWTVRRTGNLTFFTSGETHVNAECVFGTTVADELFATAIHEMTHMEVCAISENDKLFISTTGYWNAGGERCVKEAKMLEQPVTPYGKVDMEEDMCESVALFFAKGLAMQATHPIRFGLVLELLPVAAEQRIAAERRLVEDQVRRNRQQQLTDELANARPTMFGGRWENVFDPSLADPLDAPVVRFYGDAAPAPSIVQLPSSFVLPPLPAPLAHSSHAEQPIPIWSASGVARHLPPRAPSLPTIHSGLYGAAFDVNDIVKLYDPRSVLPPPPKL